MASDRMKLGLRASVLLFWLALNSSVAPAQIALGLLLAWLIPLFLARLWPTPLGRVRRPGRALRLAGVFLYDIVAANLTVARQILFEAPRLRPAFVYVPLDIDDPLAVAVLGAMITLTPGTVTVEADAAARKLVLHVLHADDPLAVVEAIKRRYEIPLKEIFAC